MTEFLKDSRREFQSLCQIGIGQKSAKSRPKICQKSETVGQKSAKIGQTIWASESGLPVQVLCRRCAPHAPLAVQRARWCGCLCASPHLLRWRKCCPPRPSRQRHVALRSVGTARVRKGVQSTVTARTGAGKKLVVALMAFAPLADTARQVDVNGSAVTTAPRLAGPAGSSQQTPAVPRLSIALAALRPHAPPQQ